MVIERFANSAVRCVVAQCPGQVVLVRIGPGREFHAERHRGGRRTRDRIVSGLAVEGFVSWELAADDDRADSPPVDLEDHPLLVAGLTSSGKSAGANKITIALVAGLSAAELASMAWWQA
jgi:hypothetical protein